MIDVSALSVSIEVDMSAFVEAMNKVMASLIANADTFEDLAKGFARAFSSIKIFDIGL